MNQPFTHSFLQSIRIAAGGLSLALAAVATAAPSGPPIRVGGTLALTGPLASTALICKLAAETFIEQINKKDGLLGRPVEWVLLDDQSKPDLARTLYEKLTTADKVDLLIGPYGTGAILSAMSVAERHSKMLIHSSFGIPKLAKYERHIPVAPFGYVPEDTYPNRLFDGLAANGKMPKTIAIISSKFSSVHFLSLGAREVAKKRGINEVLFLEFEFGTRDFGPIAARIRDAKPDFLWMGSIGLESNSLIEAMKKLDYMPRNHFHLYPAPGPLALSPDAQNALSLTFFEEHAPFTNDPVAAEFAKGYRERAIKAGLPYVETDQQASNVFVSWQVLTAAVTATKSLDDKVLTQWIKTNKINTIYGPLRFDGTNNFGDDLSKVKQVHKNKWVVVWPPEFAPPGVKMMLQ
ncbi:MAG: ABC transporter substrate-binding protein [Betaproteobacteria bacterium]|nr:ABC transporter substrate-binding protein [Betaproteobacteria bacterium]